MIVAIGKDPYFCCDACYDLIGQGMALHSPAQLRGHFPAVKTVCSERCAVALERDLVQPVHRLTWNAFLAALTEDKGARKGG